MKLRTEPDVSRRNDGFDIELADVELPALDEEHPLLPPALRQLAGLDAREVAPHHAELFRAICFSYALIERLVPLPRPWIGGGGWDKVWLGLLTHPALRWSVGTVSRGLM